MGLIRFILAMAVVIDHSDLPFAHPPQFGGIVFVGGMHAVQLFYIVSGYLITHILIENARYHDNIGSFYLNRWLRIWPAYIVVALISLATYAPNHPAITVPQQIPFGAALYLLVSNILIFGQDYVFLFNLKAGQIVPLWAGMPDIQIYQGLWVPQAWTLGVELSFYLIAPFVVRSPKRIVALLLISVAIRAVLYWNNYRVFYWDYRFFPNELALFMTGALARHFLSPLWARAAEQTRIAAAMTLSIACLSYFLVPMADAMKVTVLFGAFVLLMPAAFLYQQRSRIDSFIGDLSYPIYIGHLLTFTLWQRLSGVLGLADHTTIHIGKVVSVILFALLLNLAINYPVEFIRKQIRTGKPIAQQQFAGSSSA